MIISSLIFLYQSLSEKYSNLMLINEISEVKSSILFFHKIYKFYPGDFPRAKKIINSNYNGNGDNIISDNIESLFVFEHMQKANLIYDKNFNYRYLSHAKININMIASKYSRCGYQLLTDSKLNNINVSLDRKENFIRIANHKNKGNLTLPCTKNIVSRDIDTKLDDGNPIKGVFLSDNEFNDHEKKCICRKNEKLVNYCIFNYNENCIMQINLF